MPKGRRWYRQSALIHLLIAITVLSGSGVSSFAGARAKALTSTPVIEAAQDDAEDPEISPPAPEPTATPSATMEISTPTPEATATVAPPVDTPAPDLSPTPVATSTTPVDPTATTPPSSTPSPAATHLPTATTEPTARIAATTGVLTIHSVDLGGNHIHFTCFDIYQDAGGGALGARVKDDVCDHQDDGIIEVRLTFGAYVLVETRRPAGVGTALNKPFTIGSDRSITVKHQPLTTIVVTSTDSSTGQTLAVGGCFSLEPLTPVIDPPTGLSCDPLDDVTDGIVTLSGVDRGTYRLVEVYPPVGYLKAASREVTVSTLSSPRAVTVAHTKGATIIVHMQTEAGQPLPGACLEVLENVNGVPGERIGNIFCDNAAGINGTDDGRVEGLGFPTGTYFLRQLITPEGYLPIADRAISLTAGQTTELTLVNLLGGRLELTAVDDLGNPLPDICPSVYTDAGGGVRGNFVELSPCQRGANETDGLTTLIGLPAGNFVLAQRIGPAPILEYEYAPSADVPFTIEAGQTKPIQIVNPMGGKLVVTAVAEAQPQTKIPGACYSVYQDAGGGSRGTLVGNHCDGLYQLEPRDGVVSLNGLHAGSYVLAQTSIPAPYNLAPDHRFTIGLGEVKNVIVASKSYGKVRIFKKTPAGDALPGACFYALWGPDGQFPGSAVGDVVCDNADGANDGTIQLILPNGNFVLNEQSAPAGYALALKTDVQLRDGGITDVTIVDPPASTLVVRFANVWGERVTNLCANFHGEAPGYGVFGTNSACDGDDGTMDGRVTMAGINWGTWTVYVPQPGKYIAPQTVVGLDPGESTMIEVTLKETTPTITVGPRIDGLSQTSFTVYWETDQKTISAVTYGPLGGPQATVPETPGTPTRIHRITLTGLSADTVYTVRATPTSPNGELASAEITVRTLSTANNGRVIASIVESDGSPLPGACFAVYTDAGGGELGSHIRSSCDWADSDGNNGTVTIGGLRAGAYVFNQYYAPRPFKLARPVRFSVTEGQTKRLTVTNTRGGVALRVTSREYNGLTLTGACFVIYRNTGGAIGDYVTDLCDGFDGPDGLTTFSGIAPGDYYLWQHTTPDGYIADPIKKFTILSGQTTRNITYYSRSYADPANVVLKAVDSTGALVPGACFWLYNATNGVLYEFVDDVCDGDDGKTDGITHFTRVRDGYSYAVLEYYAPRGYVAGKLTYFTKPIGKLYSKRVTQIPGGAAVKVTTLRGSTSTKVPGACYGVYRLVNTQYIPVSVACDDWDGTVDGVTTIRGVPAGTYRIYQTFTPPGYKTPAYVTVTVGTTTRGVTVRTYPK